MDLTMVIRITGLILLIGLIPHRASANSDDHGRRKGAGGEDLPPFFEALQTVRVNSDPSVEWVQFGPGMSGNNNRGFWHPTDPDWNYQGPNMGISYYSSNRGTTYWSMLDYDAPENYTVIGPVELKAVSFSSQDENLGFCSSDKSQGMWTTGDKGRSWRYMYELDSVWQRSDINYIQADPTNDSIWYAGAGNAFDYDYFKYTHAHPHGTLNSTKPPGSGGFWTAGRPKGNGSSNSIWRSTDRGVSWSLLANTSIPKDAHIVRIAVNPLHPSQVFAATTYGVYRSEDHGLSWKLMHVDNDVVRDMDVKVDKQGNTFEIYVITVTIWNAEGSGGISSASGGLFMSSDEGETWKNLNGNMFINMTVLAEDYEIQSSYYKMLGYWFGTTPAEARKTYPKIPGHFLHNLVRVRVDPNNSSRIYVMNDYKSQVTTMPVVMWCTANGGQHWYSCWRGGKIWANTTGTAVEYWKSRGNPMGVNVHLAYLEKMWIDKQEDYFVKSGDILDFNADGTFLMTQIAKVVTNSTDHGDSWHSSQEQETSPGSGHWVGAGNSNTPCEELMQDHRFPSTLFMCTGENWLWATTGDGDLVRPNAQAGMARFMPAEASVSSVAIHPNDTKTFYTLHFRQWSAGCLTKSTDDGVTWEVVGHPVAFPQNVRNPLIVQNSLTFDPDNHSIIYFCIPALRVEYHIQQGPDFNDFGVYVSTDGGVTWGRRNAGLPENHNVNKLRFNPNNSSEFYAAVAYVALQQPAHDPAGGLYMSTNKGIIWTKVDIPEAIEGVNDVEIDQDGSVYIAAGYSYSQSAGGGVWRKAAGPTSKWEKLFYMPFVIDVEIAAYDAKTLLVAVNPSHTVDFLNPGVYLSHDAGVSWKKANKYIWQPGQLRDCAIDQVKEGVYYCATFGSGWFRGTEH